MKTKTIVSLCICIILSSCAVMINDPDDDSAGINQQRIHLSTKNYFPFENNSNWWRFSESSGNSLYIAVTDTISDDNITYYRISFREQKVDTSDDWFKRTTGDIMFGMSLTGTYKKFLPAYIDSVNGSFDNGSNIVKYSYYDSLKVGNKMFHKVIVLSYSVPVIHGFDEITLADSLGIITLKDFDGRWSIDYTLDSCSIGNNVWRF
jgi:hypothetical protein